MITKESKRKALSYIVMGLLVLGVLLITNKGNIKWAGVGLFALALVLLLLNSVGTYYYAKGSKALRGEKPDMKAALSCFEKAVKAGVDAQSEIVAATLFVQYGDMEKGRRVLEEYALSSDRKTKYTALISLSMYWWVKRDLEKAIATAREAYDAGYRDRNLYINLMTYYLEDGEYREFRRLLKESRTMKLSAAATLDLESAYHMAQGDWEKSGSALRKLFDVANPKFIDPYLHEALVCLHYGDWEEAVKSLRAIKDNVMPTNTSIYSEKEIETLACYIEDENTRWGFRKAVEDDPALLIRREMPKFEKGVEKPLCPVKPDFAAIDMESGKITDDDEAEIDTSITKEDEEWLRRHGEE